MPDPIVSPRDGVRTGSFEQRHIGTSAAQQSEMLAVVGQNSIEEALRLALGPSISDETTLDVSPVESERALQHELREIAATNRVVTSMIGLGYHDCILPAVLRRSILENPAWYSAYTPYQAEISQGRLEALLNFQTMVADLCALPIANASLLDESTAVVEAMLMCARAASTPTRFVVDQDCMPQTIAVLQTRAEPLGIELLVSDLDDGLPDGEFFGVVLQLPGASGRIRDFRSLIAAAHERNALVVIAADLLSLCLLTPPGELGADIAVGTPRRFAPPPGLGGPHAAYLATREALVRSVPGRIVGVSKDTSGSRALQLALQTREQHIRRERATSNICTAEVLPAVIAAMYAVYHGPDGLTEIAARVHRHAATLAERLAANDLHVVHRDFFDTVLVRSQGRASFLVAAALDAGVNVRLVDADTVAVACDETTTDEVIERVAQAFGATTADVAFETVPIPASLRRDGAFLAAPVFHRYRSEAALARYLRRLADLDLALDRTMIPLGSCTMKLNAAIEMETISWPEFASLHPFAPADQSVGIRSVISDLEAWLSKITGFEAVSMQPNAGSQGELAGLLAIRTFHRAHGDIGRDVCLVPASAHGTNPASARLAGMRVVEVACDEAGNIDLSELRARLDEHHDAIAALMITYPSTSGIYEPGIRTICDLVHDAGGQVYLDGANLNALIGHVRPGMIGADASHLNLHKTFCIPHGGGGPGVGPIAVKSHLAPFLPNHPLFEDAGPPTGIGPLAGAPFGSASLLVIPWAYMKLMGGDGLARATNASVLAANYLATRLAAAYKVLYRGPRGLVAHECIIDIRPFTATTGVRGEGVAKRLIDYGFHAPTMSFPVAGTLMIEPTESESLEELDRFCEAMISIRKEISDIESGKADRKNNPLKNAPHT